MNNAVFEKKLCKMWEKIEISNLPQEKEEVFIIILRSFSQKIY